MSIKAFANLFKTAQAETDKLPKLTARAEHAALSIFHGDNKQRKPDIGEDFWQFRDYAPFDRPQDIDWKQSAKTDKVFIRQKELQTNQQYYFWCQNDDAMHYSSSKKHPSKYEAGFILSAATALLLKRSGDKIRHIYSHSAQSFSDFTQDIYNSKTETLPSFTEAKQKRATLIMCGDFLGSVDQSKKLFDDFRTQFSHLIIIQTLDPAELTLPFAGRTVFDGLGHSVSRYKIENVESIRSDYISRINAHNTELMNLCKKNQWFYKQHNTEKSFDHSLWDIWLHLQHQDRRSAV